MTRDEQIAVLEGVLGLMTTQAERSPAALAGVMAVLAALQEPNAMSAHLETLAREREESEGHTP